jgi:hypothetical protein
MFLTVTLEPTADGGTLVGWNQDFENPDAGRRMERILVPANEQLFDRLSAECYADIMPKAAQMGTDRATRWDGYEEP